MIDLRKAIAGLGRNQVDWQKLMHSLGRGQASETSQTGSPLKEAHNFGSNPGNLRMFSYLPPTLAENPPLVVVLHGCTQSAAGYDFGAGWSTLAQRYGLALLLPEQQRSNNPNICFNWFQPEDRIVPVPVENGAAGAIG